MKFCQDCGTEVRDDAKFCNKCGKRVEEQSIPVPVPQPVYQQPQPVYQQTETAHLPTNGKDEPLSDDGKPPEVETDTDKPFYSSIAAVTGEISFMLFVYGSFAKSGWTLSPIPVVIWVCVAYLTCKELRIGINTKEHMTSRIICFMIFVIMSVVVLVGVAARW
ncbi:MAG: zinc ribbon domain-containing protein [Oscillospiraceae bacterium]|jgi:hypothetical protein|nr:zinc ribbon domain-containing protein [Oscillospiraceae bacterium]